MCISLTLRALPGVTTTCGLLFCLLPSGSQAQENLGKSYALTIGVESYNPKTFSQLNYAEDDALELGKALESLGFEVVTMTSQSRNPEYKPSTAAKILRQIDRRLSGLDPRDTVILSLSGHGVQFKDDPPLEDGVKEVYFCPEDADLKQRSSLVPLSKVLESLQNCRAERKLLLVDACRNEVLSNLGRSGEIELEPVGRTPKTIPKGTLAVFSCSSQEKSYEHPNLKHGIFCYHVLKYLKGEADLQFYRNRELQIEDLVYYARRETRDYALKFLSADQRPEPVGRENGWSLGKLLQRSITNSIGMALVYIPPGPLVMGSPPDETTRSSDEDQVNVVLTNGFYLGKYEVTQAEYQSVMGSNPSYFSTSGSGKDRVTGLDTTRLPVESVSWEDAVEFCRRLSAREGKTYRLPTEAEWEYACRAGMTTPYSFGTSLNGDKANCDGNYPFGTTVKGTYLGRTSPIGSYQPNAFGVYDMHGNVWEWCQDVYTEQLPGGRDPLVTSGGSNRVDRGGGWYFSAASCRSAYRSRDSPGNRDVTLGFRVALVPSQ